MDIMETENTENLNDLSFGSQHNEDKSEEIAPIVYFTDELVKFKDTNQTIDPQKVQRAH